MRKLRLRRADQCGRCDAELLQGAEAWWDAGTKTVSCIGCADVAPAHVAVLDLPADVPVDESAGELPAEEVASIRAMFTDEERGIPGASARAERARRTSKREEKVRAKHRKLGGLFLALSDDPTSTKVWDQGAIGEELVGRHLEAARPRGIEVLHDRRIPRSTANIDHLVVAPGGVWVVDAKRYLSGRLECRDVGGWFTIDRRLFVGDRDKSALIDGVLKQVEVVRQVLASSPFAETPVRGALCFVGADVGLFAKPFELRGVNVTWRKHLVEPMLAPVDGSPVDDAGRQELVAHLARLLRPA